MGLRYKDVKFIDSLVENDYFFNYFHKNFFKINYKKNKYNSFFFLLKKKYTFIYYFRYIFWTFINQNINVIFIFNFYKYMLNYIFFLYYLKYYNIKYYNLYYTKTLYSLKKNKKKQKKYIRYLSNTKKVKIIFFFKLNNYKIDFIYNNLKKRRLKIFEINLINPNYIFFFNYINYII